MIEAFSRVGGIELWKETKISTCRPPVLNMRNQSHTNKVSVLEVEPVELIASLFGVVDVLVNDECGSLGRVGNTLADLSNDKMASQQEPGRTPNFSIIEGWTTG